MNASKVYLILLLLLPFYFCQIEQKQEGATAEVLFSQHCGSCHELPNPAHLTKDVWANSVLPRMGWRLGIRRTGDDPYKGLEQAEIAALKSQNIYPEQAALDSIEWLRLQKHIINLAPTNGPVASERLGRCQPGRQFVRKDLHVDQIFGSTITAIEFDTQKKELWISDYDKNVWQWTTNGNRNYELSSPVVDFHFSDAGTLFTQIGHLYPSELKAGTISLFDGKRKTDLLQNIHRPVHAEYQDLDKDGSPELIVAKYGNQLGSFSIYTKKGNAFEEQILIQQPGAIKFYIQDINNDGLLDIAVLFAQGDESIYFLYQENGLKFRSERQLRFPAEYGTSDFALFDYDQDGDLDMASVHGDNADYSYILKPYHGLRLHINDGNKFEEKFFFPLFGATKLQVEDFDEDGDIDFALSAFFPDFDQLLEESFVYLENKAYQEYRFEPKTIKGEEPIRSLTLEKADFDGDGDQDLIMGLFMISPQPIPLELEQQWKQSKMDIAVYLNTLK